MTLRTATPDDAQALLDIYAPYVTQTAITFEYDVPSLQEFRERIRHTLEAFPYLVVEDEGIVMGYAYASKFHPRAAYSWCAETSIYIRMGHHGHGYGKALYTELEDRLRAMGILNVNACITWVDQPNAYVTHQSPEFHAHMGYTRCAHFHKCGLKFGQWFDMIWMEKMLGEHKTE